MCCLLVQLRAVGQIARIAQAGDDVALSRELGIYRSTPNVGAVGQMFLGILHARLAGDNRSNMQLFGIATLCNKSLRSEEHTSELQSR